MCVMRRTWRPCGRGGWPGAGARVPERQGCVRVALKRKSNMRARPPSRRRFALSTKKLEPAPGDFIRNPQVVFDRAEEMAALFKDRISATENVEKEAEA